MVTQPPALSPFNAARRLWLVGVLCLLTAAIFPNAGHCVPACPGGAQTKQPDGTRITIVLKGDEHFHWNEDAAGYLISQSPATSEWVYAIETNGVVAPTQHVVGRDDPAALGLPRPDLHQMALAAGVRQNQLTTMGMGTLTATTGTMKNLVVLVSFSDLAVAYTRQQFDDLFNQIGYTADGAVGSVKDYYHEVSYNALTVQSTVVEAVTLDHGYAYYGGNDGLGNDKKPQQMVSEALAKLDQRGFDFTTVDGDGDGWVDGLDIIHAGGGEEYSGNDTNYIWSHQWGLPSVVTYDGIRMQNYHTEPARRGWDSTPSSQGITRIGVICHETGHFLGLPDLYDTGYDSEGVGDFCLMAGGSWGGDYGNRPVHMSAWCKADLGWVTPTTISTVGTRSLAQIENNQQIYKIRGACASNDYFLIENRQGVGFDQSLPGSSRGILIWHIDENQPNNDDQTHYHVDLEEASCTQDLAANTNSGDDADYFRLGNATSFTDTTCPNNYCYSGVACGLNVLNVSATGANMTFDVALPGCVPPSISGNPADQSVFAGSTASFSVTAGGTSLTYQWQVSTNGGATFANVTTGTGGTTATYTTPATVIGDNGKKYRCVVSGACSPSATSTAATLTVNAALTINPPYAYTWSMGQSVSDCLGASGGAVPYHDWIAVAQGAGDYTYSILGSSSFSAVGIAKGWNADDSSWSYTLPFTFPFYGTNRTSVNVCSNGFLDFISTNNNDYSNTSAELVSNVRIAPLWDDLVTTSGDIYVDESVSGQVTIRWQGVTYSGSYAANVAVVLFSDGRIRFDYGSGNTGLTPTVGISSGNGTKYILVPGYDGATSRTNANSVLFTPTGGQSPLPPGVSLDPSSGCFSGAPTTLGDYSGPIQVSDSSSPAQTKQQTFTFHVVAAPQQPTSPTDTPSTICSGGSSTLSATAGSGGDQVWWYAVSCGGEQVGTGLGDQTVSPNTTTTYYARTKNSATGIWSPDCASVTVTVDPLPVAPTEASANPAAICAGASTTLTANGGSGYTLLWSTSCHGTVIASGNGVSVSPTSTTTYFASWHGNCGDSDCASVTVTVNPLPVAPTSASADPAAISSGASSTVTATGGSGDSCKWYTDSCGGTLVGTGVSISVSPTSTTQYWVCWENSCGSSTCATTTVTVNAHAYAVRVSDLSRTPIPPNPIRVWGKVTSESPVKISDGKAEITLIGLTASLGEYLVVTGDWNGTVLTVNGGITRYPGPAPPR